MAKIILNADLYENVLTSEPGDRRALRERERPDHAGQEPYHQRGEHPREGRRPVGGHLLHERRGGRPAREGGVLLVQHEHGADRRVARKPHRRAVLPEHHHADRLRLSGAENAPYLQVPHLAHRW